MGENRRGGKRKNVRVEKSESFKLVKLGREREGEEKGG